MANFVEVKPQTGVPVSTLKTPLAVSKVATSNNALYQTVSGLITAAGNFQGFVNGAFDSFTNAFNSVSSTLDTFFEGINQIITVLADRNSHNYGVSVANSGGQSVTTATGSKVNLGFANFDSGHYINGNNLIVPTNGFGQYLVSGSVSFSFHALGYREVVVVVNDAIDYVVAQLHGGLTDDMVIPFTVLLELGDGDAVSVQVYQTSGSTLTVSCTLQMVRISYV